MPLEACFLWWKKKKGNNYTIPCANQRTFDGEQSFPDKGIKKLKRFT